MTRHQGVTLQQHKMSVRTVLPDVVMAALKLTLRTGDGRVTLAVEAVDMHGENGHPPAYGSVRSLILRAWFEPGAVPRLRVRITEIDPSLIERPSITTASVGQVCRAVRSWLGALRRHDPGAQEQ